MSSNHKAGGPPKKARTSHRRKRAASDRARGKAIEKRLSLARNHVYWASGIVVCCAYAAAAGLYPQPDRQDIGHALLERAGGAVIDVLDDELDEGSEA